MIIKKCQTRNGKSLKGLINYLSTGEDERRILEIGYRNLELTDPRLVALEMMAFMQESKEKRREEQGYGHYVISWRPEEKEKLPSASELVTNFCEKMEYDKFQCYWVKHGDTENEHIHIIVNRVIPREKKVIPLREVSRFEINKINKCRIEIELEYELRERNEQEADEKVNKASQLVMEPSMKNKNIKISNNLMVLFRKEIELIRSIIKEGKSCQEIEDRLEQRGWIYCKHKESDEIALINEARNLCLSLEYLGEEYSPERIMERLKFSSTKHRKDRTRKGEGIE